MRLPSSMEDVYCCSLPSNLSTFRRRIEESWIVLMHILRYDGDEPHNSLPWRQRLVRCAPQSLRTHCPKRDCAIEKDQTALTAISRRRRAIRAIIYSTLRMTPSGTCHCLRIPLCLYNMHTLRSETDIGLYMEKRFTSLVYILEMESRIYPRSHFRPLD